MFFIIQFNCLLVDSRQQPLEGCKVKTGHYAVQLGWELGPRRSEDCRVLSQKVYASWDLHRLGHFSKEIIHTINNKFSISFQVKGCLCWFNSNCRYLTLLETGHSITVYTAKLSADGIYAMLRLTRIQIPQSVESLGLLTAQSTLNQLLQVAYVFEKIRLQKKEETLSWSGMDPDRSASWINIRWKDTLYIAL